MLCEHLEKLQHFVRENELEIGGLDMLLIVCKKCNVQHECRRFPWSIGGKVRKTRKRIRIS